MRILCGFVFLIPVFAVGQFTYKLDQSIPVQLGGVALPNAWAGGINAAQVNTIDLNFDGQDDLAIFDRAANKVITFLAVDNAYLYAPEYERFFPDDLQNWMLLRDFNCDGRKDIFTGNIFGIKVYQNISEPNQPPAWKQFWFYGSGGSRSEALLTLGFSGKINLQLNFDDMPAIADADGDGDLDIFNPRFAGTATIEYHRNYSMERYASCDSLDFERITTAWGNVLECECGDFAFNGDDCTTNGRIEHSGGKSFLALDIDNNGAVDLVYSETECATVYTLLNEGTVEFPIITTASIFPTADAINLIDYPATYFEDVDFDGVKDLLVSPNLSVRSFPEVDFQSSLWLYKNTGTNDLPQFIFQQNNFLQDQMIDVGDNAVPAFIDIDSDGDLDLFIGYNTNTTTGSISFYENTGTSINPAFHFNSNDAFNLAALNFTNIKPAFADINRDGKIDLVFTATEIATGITKLYFIPNMNDTGIAYSISNLQTTTVTINRNENVALADINQDGYVDLLIGRSIGSLEYWRNIQSATPAFVLEDDSYLGYGVSTARLNLSCHVADLDGDSRQDLIVANQRGEISILNDFRNASDASFTIANVVFNPLMQEFPYSTYRFGGQAWATTARLFADSRSAILIGNTQGGLHLLRNDGGQELPDEPLIEVYPNPIHSASQQLTLRTDRGAEFQIYNSLGQQIVYKQKILPFQEYKINIPIGHNGLYFLRFFIDGRSIVRKLIIY